MLKLLFWIIVIGKEDVWDTPFDCSATIEDMPLLGHAMGLGSCWVNAATLDVRGERQFNSILNIPDAYKTISIITFGKKPRSYL